MFSENLKKLRKEQRLSQAEFAEKLKFAQSTVGMWESGKREPDLKTMKIIADFFGISVDALIGNEPIGINIQNSAIGNGSNNTITFRNGGVHTRSLSEIEAELLKVCERLDMKQKTKLLSYAYSLEEK